MMQLRNVFIHSLLDNLKCTCTYTSKIYSKTHKLLHAKTLIRTHTHLQHDRTQQDTTRHSFKLVNNSRWVIACAVLTPAPYVHKQHHYQGNWSASSPAAPTHCKASVSHCATISAIALPQHKEKGMMRDGLCAVVAYRPCFMACFPLWLRDMLLYPACCVSTLCVLLSTGAKRRLLYIQGLKPDVRGSRRVHGGVLGGHWIS